jgi:hypothetical protein
LLSARADRGIGGRAGRRRRKRWFLAGLAGEGGEEERRQAPPVGSASPPLESNLRRAGRRRAPTPFPSGVRWSDSLPPLLPPSLPCEMCPCGIELVDMTGRSPLPVSPPLHLPLHGSQRQHRDARRVGCDCWKPCFCRRISSLSFAHKGYLPLEMSSIDVDSLRPSNRRCAPSTMGIHILGLV